MRADESNELERSLGLLPALAIGVGTMVGAGVFVFPGLAGGQAGVGATFSFILAGAVALLVAWCTAELATAMPQSGGGYFFVSRVLGVGAGTLVGIGQSIGLVFATAFYLSGFAEYVLQLLERIGVSITLTVSIIGAVVAVLLALLNFFGTEKVGKAQNIIVICLLIILLVLFGYGLADVLGIAGPGRLPTELAPRGVGSIFGTTALVFTSFLGFVQIATVAGEVTTPYKTLPRALVGSVLIATLIYVLVLFVTTSVFSADRLSELGETATVAVGRELAGGAGEWAILLAGLLATLSSANASILSASRSVYALGRDDLLPERTGRLHPRYHTPHYALLIIGIPTVACLFIGRIQVLAEVASLLHLILYGLICFTLVVIRRRKPLWYVPTFRIPFYPVVPIVGALCCFALIAFMEPLSMALGGGALVLISGWYLYYTRGKDISPPRPTHVVPEVRQPYVLLPFRLKEGEEETEHLPAYDWIRDLSPFRLLVLGYRVVPEQVSPQQAREADSLDRESTLRRAVDQVPVSQDKVNYDMAYTSDPAALLDRYLQEEHCQAMLLHAGASKVQRLVIPLANEQDFDARLATFLREMLLNHNRPVRLVLLDNDDQDQDQEAFASSAQRRLARSGLTGVDLTVETAAQGDIVSAVQDSINQDDLLVVYNPDAADRTKVMARLREDVAVPVLFILPRWEESASA